MKVISRYLLVPHGFFRVAPEDKELFEYAEYAYLIGEGRKGQNYYLIVPNIEDGNQISILATGADGCGCSTPFSEELFKLIFELKSNGVVSYWRGN